MNINKKLLEIKKDLGLKEESFYATLGYNSVDVAVPEFIDIFQCLASQKLGFSDYEKVDIEKDVFVGFSDSVSHEDCFSLYLGNHTGTGMRFAEKEETFYVQVSNGKTLFKSKELGIVSFECPDWLWNIILDFRDNYDLENGFMVWNKALYFAPEIQYSDEEIAEIAAEQDAYIQDVIDSFDGDEFDG